MKYYIIAGEASGDMHGANLILALSALDPEAQYRCFGGDRMQAAGGVIVRHIRDLAFMGFWEVVRHLPTIMSNIRFCKKDIADYVPDVVILIDYPGFNFRLLPFIKSKNIPIIYYISPQLWAWKSSRVKQVKAYVDKMIVIFPFEQAFYRQHGVEVDYCGHPLLDELAKHSHPQQTSNIIAILPGSRRQEIQYMLPAYLAVVAHFPSYRFVIAGIRAHGEAFYQSMIGSAVCDIVWDETYTLLARSQAAIVTSGTATLETALHGVPQVICYRASPLSYRLARLLVKGIKYIGIVNLIADKLVVKELIQDQLTTSYLIAEVNNILNPNIRSQILADYATISEQLGNAGASPRVAGLIHAYLQKRSKNVILQPLTKGD
jgi:lipid-A-disaccharide synthase